MEAPRRSQGSPAQATPLRRAPRTTSNTCLEHKGKTSSFLSRLLRRGLLCRVLRSEQHHVWKEKSRHHSQVWADLRPTQTMSALKFPNTCLLKLHQMEMKLERTISALQTVCSPVSMGWEASKINAHFALHSKC